MKKILWVLAMLFAFTSMAFAAVNLNTATKDELDAVKGIGPATADGGPVRYGLRPLTDP